MSTFISEPGTRLGGRYRLEDRMSASSGWSVWKAIDETLARPVTVLALESGFPRIAEAVTAAQAAGRLTDSRLAQVFDVEEDWDHAYVVMEWVGGDSLDDLLAGGPLDPAQGAEIVAQAAEALGSAHDAGVAHLCLTPGSLRWTPGGGVKIVGLGIDAALAGATSDDPAVADTRGLGRLLYAAVTAHWPGGGWPGLPPAPEVDGHPRSPRQVRAGVPAVLDEITSQAMFQHGGGPPLTTPALLGAALTRAIPAPLAPPPPPEPMFGGRGFFYGGMPAGPELGQPPYWEDFAGPPNQETWPPDSMPRERPARHHRGLATFVVLLVLAAAAAGAYVLRGHGGGGAGGGNTPSQQPTSPSSAVQVLVPQTAGGFDPLSSATDDPRNENSYQAHFAIDTDLGTAWESQWYASPRFGGTKAGTGLILDMGKPVKLASVAVTFGDIPGADVRIEVGNSNIRSPGTLQTFTTVARGFNLSGAHTFGVQGTATGRYLLIWFTKLPPKSATSGNQFEAKVFNVVVRGSG
jgi:serine/threonine protein kinase